MFTVTWIAFEQVHSISSPSKDTAELLVAILPRWMRPRLWHKAPKQALLLLK